MALFDLFKKTPKAPAQLDVTQEPGVLLMCVDGEVIPQEQIGDGVFSSGVMGLGCGFIPASEDVYAPVSGTVSAVADTKHAVGLETEDGVEILIHIGLETVSMKGEGFEMLVSEGDKVVAGQKLMHFSRKAIDAAAARGVSPVSAFLVTNSDDLPMCQVLVSGSVKAGQPLIKVK